MALKSESPSPPNEVVDIVPSKSAPEPDEDLEDGEIFDDDDDEPVPAPKPAEPAAPQKESIATIVQQMQQMQQQMGLVGPGGGGMGIKRRGSSMDRGRPRVNRLKRAKRLRDDDRPFVSKKRRRSDDEKPNKEAATEEEEEDLGRDVSPQRDSWFRSDDEDDELGFNDAPGVRGGARRGRRDFGRSRRGGRGARGGGRRNNNRRDGGLCKFFLQGNCQRGNDCPFSHTIYPRKYELCRFYMNDCCVKKDKCNYMHEDFPCKFWHMGLKCYAGKRCKFSHQKITPYIKQMLLKHNQSETDKHFIQHLQTLGDSRSPTPPDYSDYEAPSGNSNYVIVGRKRGTNKDDITVDDIELLESDHDDRDDRPERHDRDDRERHDREDRPEREDREAPSRSEKGARSHRHRSERSNRHSRDEDHRDQDDHRDRGHKDQDDRRDRVHKDQDDHRDRGHKDLRSDRNDRTNKADRDSTRSSHHNRDRERDCNPSLDDRRSDEEDGRTPMPSPSQQSNDSRDIEAVDSREPSTFTPPPASKDKDKSSRQRDRDKDSRRKDKDSRQKDRDSRQRDHKSKKGRSMTKSRSRSRSQSRTRSLTRTPSPPPPRDRESNQSSAKGPPSQEVPAVETSAPSDVPPNLPKKQMELYLRIQQQQREAGNIEDEDEPKDKENEDKDDWYSSDEEGGAKSGPLATILNKLKSQPKTAVPEPPKVDIPNVSAIPDFDISAVSKLLSSVRETIEQNKNAHQPPQNAPSRPEPPKTEEKIAESPRYEEKRRRDPRLLMRGGDSTPPSSSPTRQQMKLPPLDIDLRVPSSSAGPLTGDVDLRQLPFKPVPMHQAAKEIDASTTANPPIPWVLTKFPNPPKPEYSHIHPKNPMDPRLKKYQAGTGMPPLPPQMNQIGMGGGGFVLPPYNQAMQQPPMQPMGGLPGPPQPTAAARDPRQRAFATNDPRRKPSTGPPVPAMPVGQFPNQMGFPPGRPGMPPMGVPGMPMYPGRQDSDLRNPNPFLQNDIDFRFQQPASHPHYP